MKHCIYIFIKYSRYLTVFNLFNSLIDISRPPRPRHRAPGTPPARPRIRDQGALNKWPSGLRPPPSPLLVRARHSRFIILPLAAFSLWRRSPLARSCAAPHDTPWRPRHGALFVFPDFSVRRANPRDATPNSNRLPDECFPGMLRHTLRSRGEHRGVHSIEPHQRRLTPREYATYRISHTFRTSLQSTGNEPPAAAKYPGLRSMRHIGTWTRDTPL